MKLFKIASLTGIFMLALAFAQSFTGNYVLQDDTVKLTLEQQKDGLLIGQLSGNELSYELEGELSPDDPNTAYGYMYTDEGNYLFAVVLEEPVLNMILFGILENGEANPDDSNTYVFMRLDDLGPNAKSPQKQEPADDTKASESQTPASDQEESSNPGRPPSSNSATTASQTANSEKEAEKQNPVSTNPLATNPLSTGSPSENPLVAADPFVGTFEGEDLKLVLFKSGSSYSGSLTFKGSSYPLTARKKASGLVGSFKVGDKFFSFSAALADKKLTLVSDGAIYSLTKK